MTIKQELTGVLMIHRSDAYTLRIGCCGRSFSKGRKGKDTTCRCAMEIHPLQSEYGTRHARRRKDEAMKNRLNVLLINGSPRGSASNTYALARAFIRGMGDIELKEIAVYKADIQHCRGCQYCLTQQPGHCIITDDDMASILQDFKWADITIWSMPLFDFSIPSKTKALLDRLMPMFSVAMKIDEDGFPAHLYLDSSYRSDTLLISTAGFPVAEHNYELLTGYMQRRFRSTYKGAVTMPQGELMRTDPRDPMAAEIKTAIEEYLKKVSDAGSYFREHGELSAEIQEELKRPILNPADYMDGVNAVAAALTRQLNSCRKESGNRDGKGTEE